MKIAHSWSCYVSSNRLQIPSFCSTAQIAGLQLLNPCVPSMDVQPLPTVDEMTGIVGEVGEGASGIVWSADWDADSIGKTRKVALKILRAP